MNSNSDEKRAHYCDVIVKEKEKFHTSVFYTAYVQIFSSHATSNDIDFGVDIRKV